MILSESTINTAIWRSLGEWKILTSNSGEQFPLNFVFRA